MRVYIYKTGGEKFTERNKFFLHCCQLEFELLSSPSCRYKFIVWAVCIRVLFTQMYNAGQLAWIINDTLIQNDSHTNL